MIGEEFKNKVRKTRKKTKQTNQQKTKNKNKKTHRLQLSWDSWINMRPILWTLLTATLARSLFKNCKTSFCPTAKTDLALITCCRCAGGEGLQSTLCSTRPFWEPWITWIPARSSPPRRSAPPSETRLWVAHPFSLSLLLCSHSSFSFRFPGNSAVTFCFWEVLWKFGEESYSETIRPLL